MLDRFISHTAPGAPTDRQHGRGYQYKPGAGLKGLAYAGVFLEQKTQEQRATIRGTFRGREKYSYCEIFEHF